MRPTKSTVHLRNFPETFKFYPLPLALLLRPKGRVKYIRVLSAKRVDGKKIGYMAVIFSPLESKVKDE